MPCVAPVGEHFLGSKWWTFCHFFRQHNFPLRGEGICQIVFEGLAMGGGGNGLFRLLMAPLTIAALFGASTERKLQGFLQTSSYF